MASPYRYVAGAVVGGWTLLEPLGRGGNSEVWKATKESAEVALKISYGRRDTEPYQRFRDREVPTMRDLRGTPGVLPLLGDHLPEEPTRRDPAWITLPVAEVIDEALAEAPVLEVVRAMASIARTLAELAERGIAHRDIKPGNLFRHDGEWAVGDFGLVAFPEAVRMTEGERRLGPAHFLAPEMLANPRDADPFKADVYSFGKTIWALTTRHQTPPPGEHRQDTRGMRISDYVDSENLEQLDLLVERCTSYAPADRPTMLEVATELEAWASGHPPGKTLEPPDPSKLMARVGTVLGPGQKDVERRERAANAETAAMRRLAYALDFVAGFAKRAGIHEQVLEERVAAGVDGPARSGLIRTDFEPSVVAESAWLVLIDPTTQWPVGEIGVCVAAFGDGTLDIAGQILFAPGGAMNESGGGWASSGLYAGSAQLTEAVEEISDALVAGAPAVVQRFLDIIEDAERKRDTD